MRIHDVLIIGAGPAGLATAIAASRRGLDYLVVEKGALVNSLLHYPTEMVFFTTPELMEVGGLPFVSPYDKPTRIEALRYYRRVADAFKLEIAFDETVLAVSREEAALTAARPFTVDVQSSRLIRRSMHARTVVIATGAYDVANRIGVPGEDLPHVSHYYTNPHPFFRKRVVVVGGKNSAAETALDLFRAGASVTLVHRHPGLGESIKYWVKPDIENRIKEGSIAARFDSRVVEITQTHVTVERLGTREQIPAERVFLLTGYHPDVDLMRTAGVRCDDQTLAPEYDAETFETNVPNLFVAGGAVAGRNTGTIFIENGRFHGEKIVALLARRLRSA